MRNPDKEVAIIEILGNYAEGAWFHQTRSFPAGVYAVYARALVNYPLVVIDIAMQDMVNTSNFWPTVAEIKKRIILLIASANDQIIVNPSEAWAEIMAQVKHCGIYSHRKPTFSSAEVELTAKRYGWRDLCMLETKDVGIARAQIMRIYQEIMDTKQEREQAKMAIETIAPKQLAQLKSIDNKVKIVCKAKEISSL